MKNCTWGTLLFLSAVSCQSTDQMPPEAIAQLDAREQQMFAAFDAGDSAMVRSITGLDYFTINADGNALEREEAIRIVPRFKGATTKLSEQRQRLYGNFALRQGRARFYLDTMQVAEVLYSTGWVYRNNVWEYVHWQGTMTGMMLDPLRDKVMLSPPEQ